MTRVVAAPKNVKPPEREECLFFFPRCVFRLYPGTQFCNPLHFCLSSHFWFVLLGGHRAVVFALGVLVLCRREVALLPVASAILGIHFKPRFGALRCVA